jgi:acyl carrier protein
VSPIVVDPSTTTVRPDGITIEDWLIETVAERLDLAPDDIEIDEPFTSYGLGSMDAVMLTGDLQDWLSRELSATLLWEYPTIKQLAAYLAYS